MTREFVEVKIDTLSFTELLDDKSVEQVIQEVRAIEEQYTGRSMFFRVEPYGYDGGLELKLWERRLETDWEYEKRLSDERQIKERSKAKKLAAEAKDRAEYERLKKKFKGA